MQQRSTDTLVELAHRMITDPEFRSWVLSNPQEATRSLGISKHAYRALVAVLPLVLAAGIPPLSDPPPIAWW